MNLEVATSEHPPTNATAWGPLRYSVFRALWLAALVSNLGALMQNVAAAWLMTDLTPSPVPVALLTTMASLPLFMVGLPAGALADVIDRRWLVIVTQIWMLVVAAALAGLTAIDVITPWMLLALTFLLGLGGALSAPAWQAIVPDLVPRHEFAAAVALNSAGFNLARAIGPALGGLMIAATGPAAVFLLNAASFLGIIVVMARWHPPERVQTAPPERVRSAVAAGMRFTRHSPPLRAVLVRTGVFIGTASALWALLPVVASHELGLSAAGYGVLLGSIGLGAIGGASILPRLRERFSTDQLVIGLTLIFAAGMVGLAYLHNLILLNLVLATVGVGWLSITSAFNVTAQTMVPAWVQARALGVYLLVFQGGFAGGSAVWGVVADRLGVQTALLIAAGLMVLGVLTARRWPLMTDDELDLNPSQHWPAPVLAWEPDLEAGPVMITVEYRIAQPQQAAFVQAMREVQILRLRDGATTWGLFHDTATPERFVETFEVASWAEHLRQHERVTIADHSIERRALAFQQPGTEPVVSHLISTVAEVELLSGPAQASKISGSMP
ncbi:MAG TPA: MFS transporter [Herpetosiphonaceae bacterium]